MGTVGGISKTSDGGHTWQRFTSSNQNRPISGNWVIGLWHNPYDNSVWATTLNSQDGEFNAISRTTNGGVTWDIFLEDELSGWHFSAIRRVLRFRNLCGNGKWRLQIHR
ncbi:MAG: hypothetical protein R3C26_14415 [Calditrichia bacterium]